MRRRNPCCEQAILEEEGACPGVRMSCGGSEGTRRSCRGGVELAAGSLSAAQLLVVSFGSLSLSTAGAGKDTQTPAAAWFLAGNKPFFQFLSWVKPLIHHSAHNSSLGFISNDLKGIFNLGGFAGPLVAAALNPCPVPARCWFSLVGTQTLTQHSLGSPPFQERAALLEEFLLDLQHYCKYFFGASVHFVGGIFCVLG